MKILIVEDESDLLLEIEHYLTESGYLCETTMSFQQGEEKIGLYQYDLVVLDLSLPGGNGLELLQQLRKRNPDTGILIISAKDSLDDKLKGLDHGADDYLTKPFHLAELNSRIHAIFRRRHLKGFDYLIFREIKLYPQGRIVMIGKETPDLTRKEYELLLYFLLNKNRVLSKQAIAEHLWGDNYDMAESYDFLYVHINNLRKKLLTAGGGDYIKNIYGIGYKWSEK